MLIKLKIKNKYFMADSHLLHNAANTGRAKRGPVQCVFCIARLCLALLCVLLAAYYSPKPFFISMIIFAIFKSCSGAADKPILSVETTPRYLAIGSGESLSIAWAKTLGK